MKHAHAISWILFALLGVLFLVASLVSVNNAYRNRDADLIAGRHTPARIAGGDEEIATALSARRGTAAAFGVSYAVLLLAVTLYPYRRRRPVWAFRALVLASLLNAGIILLRVPLLHTGSGTIAGTVPLVLTILAAMSGVMAPRPEAKS